MKNDHPNQLLVFEKKDLVIYYSILTRSQVKQLMKEKLELELELVFVVEHRFLCCVLLIHSFIHSFIDRPMDSLSVLAASATRWSRWASASRAM